MRDVLKEIQRSSIENKVKALKVIKNCSLPSFFILENDSTMF